MSHFDEAARTWDQNPAHFQRAEAVFSAIVKKIPIDQTARCLDFGCGTGILSFLFHPRVHSIVCTDSSREMLKKVQEKIKSIGIGNISTRHISAVDELASLETPFDCLYTLMVLHHIADLDASFRVFSDILRPHGYLCIADLVSEDGSFHQHLPDFQGHRGFDRAVLADMLQKSGFSEISYEIVYTIVRQAETGEKKEYPLFLLIAEKM